MEHIRVTSPPRHRLPRPTHHTEYQATAASPPRRARRPAAPRNSAPTSREAVRSPASPQAGPPSRRLALRWHRSGTAGRAGGAGWTRGARGAENLRPWRGRGAQPKGRGRTSHPARYTWYRFCEARKPEGIEPGSPHMGPGVSNTLSTTLYRGISIIEEMKQFKSILQVCVPETLGAG